MFIRPLHAVKKYQRCNTYLHHINMSEMLHYSNIKVTENSQPDWSWPANMPPSITKSAPAPTENNMITIDNDIRSDFIRSLNQCPTECFPSLICSAVVSDHYWITNEEIL